MSDEETTIINEDAYGGIFTRMQLETLMAVAKTKTYVEADKLLNLNPGTVKSRMHLLRKMRRQSSYMVAGFNNLIKQFPELRKVLETDRRVG